MSNSIEVQERNFAYQNRLQTFSLVNREHIDINQFLFDAFPHFEQKINFILETYNIIKVSGCFCAVFEKANITAEGEVLEKQTLYIHTKTCVVEFETDLEAFYNEFISSYIQKKIDDFQMHGSGFTLSEIKELNIQVSHFQPIRGSSFIDLPKFLKSKKAIINVQNNDNQCFKYAILSALYPATSNPHRATNYYPYMNKLDFTNIKFPVQLTDIAKFEQQNPTISVNVYHFDDEKKLIQPLRLTKAVKTNHIHLLLLTEESNDIDNTKFHYCWIKKLSALLRFQISLNNNRKYLCDRCFNHFYSAEKLENHVIACLNQNETRIDMPSPGKNKITFENYNKQLQVPFIIYADVESILKKPEEEEEEFSKSEATKAIQQHEAYSIGYYFKSAYEDVLKSLL